MKVITLGMSPYNTSSVSRLHRWILNDLFLKGHDVMSLSWAHDISYYIPDEKGQHWYKFGPSGESFQIPLLVLRKGLSDPVPVYEAINQLEPDVVITIGELVENGIMKAVKTFVSKPFKWLAVLSQSQFPTHGEATELSEYMDGVLCLSEVGQKSMAKIFEKPTIQSCFSGSDLGLHSTRRDESKFRIMAMGKTIQVDNLPMLMECCANLKHQIPELELYIHANIHDKGEYQFESLKSHFDPDDSFIRLPEKFVSLIDGISDDELISEYTKSDVFVSAPLAAGCSMSVFEAIGCGCFPILSDCPVNRNIAEEIEKECGPELRRDDILVPGIQLMTAGETYLTVPDPQELESRIVAAHINRKKIEGYSERLAVFSQKNSNKAFVETLVAMITKLKDSSELLCLETL